RCVAWLAFSRGWVEGKSFTVETGAGPLGVSVTADNIVRAGVGTVQRHRITDLAVSGHTVHPVGIGNPHAVMFVDDTTVADVDGIGAQVGGDHLFPDGANVEFLHVVDESTVDLRVWERGVGETQACATGAAAAVFVAHEQGQTGDEVTVRLPGGELLIGIDGDDVWMQGPAHLVFSGSVQA
ncbi:MAG: diaminopimelate epimerase, partial [Acidimicrobiia bacterium]|nr:diaminopimelate epimerase [Acidimicrobiia bacterium]